MPQQFPALRLSADEITTAVRRLRGTGREYVIGLTACDATGTAKVLAEVEVTVTGDAVDATVRTVRDGVVTRVRGEYIGSIRHDDATLAAGLALLVRDAAGNGFHIAHAHSRSVFNRTAEVA